MKSKLIICPFSMQNSLLALYRKDNPFCNVKCLSKEELLNHKYGHYSKEAISYLMVNRNYTYENARTLLKYARFTLEDYIDDKLHELYLLRKELIEKNLLHLNPYYSNLYVDKEIHVYGYSEKDVELSKCLDGNDIIFHTNDLCKCGGNYSKYDSLDNEIYAMLNNIAQLIDQEININDIYILCGDHLALYYIKKHCNSFGFNVNLDSGIPVFNLGITKRFFEIYKETKDLQQAVEWIKSTDSEYVIDLLEEIQKNTFSELSFEQQIDYLSNAFKKLEVKPIKYDNAVTIISEPIEKQNIHVFVPTFVQGKFPRAFKDDEYLNDLSLSKLKMNTSYIKGEIFEDIFLSFFSRKGISFYYSYCDHSFTDTFYASPWIEKLNLNPLETKMPTMFYSFRYSDYLYAKCLDLRRIYNDLSSELLSLEATGPLVEYMDYDNIVNRIDVYNCDSNLRHSYTRINQYFECPFKYYLSSVLKVDGFEETYDLKKGSFAHKIFEEGLKNDLEFEDIYEKEKTQFSWLPKEEILLVPFKEQIKTAYEAMKLHSKEYMNEHNTLFEERISIQIEPKAVLTGSIDKAIILNNKELYIFDYKSGSSNKFEPDLLKYGISMQLPTYAYLASESETLKELDVCGFYYQQVLNKSFKIEYKEGEIIPEYLKLSGVTTDDKEAATRFDTSIANGSSKFIKGYKLKKDGSYSSSCILVTKDEMHRYIEQVEALYMDASFKIRQNEFQIEPKSIGNHDACKYCNFKDICFVQPHQKVKLSNNEDEEDEENGI